MQLTTSIVQPPTTALVSTAQGAATVALQPYMGAGGVTTTLIPVHVLQGQTPQADPSSTPIISLSDVLSYMRSYWKRGLLAAAPVAALTFLYLGFGQPTFEAESKIKINLQDQHVLDLNGQKNSAYSELSAPMIINNHRTGLKSRRFVDYLFTKLTDSERNAFLSDSGQVGLKTRLLLALGIGSPPKAMPPEEVFAAKIDKAVRVEPIKESHILRIQLRDSNSQRAAEMANQYVKSYIDYVAEDSLSGMVNAHDVLQKESTDLRARLEERQQELAAFRRQTGIVDTNPTGEVNTQRVDSLVRAVTEAEVAWIKAGIDLNEMRKAQASGDPASVKGLGTDPQVIEMRKVREETSAKRAALLEWCGPMHPKVLAFEKDLQRMDADLLARANELVSSASAEEARLKMQYEQLTEQLAAAKGEFFDRNPDQLQNEFLKEETKTDRDLYNQVLLRLKQTALATRFKDTSELSIADVAVPPESAISPRRSIALLASILFFGMIGLTVPIASGLWDEHVRPLLGKLAPEEPPSPAPDSEPYYQVPSGYSQPFSQPPVGATLPPPPQHYLNPMAGASPFQNATAATSPFQSMHAASPSGPMYARSASQTQIIATIPELMAAEGPVQLGELLHPGVGSSGNAISGLAATLESHQMQRVAPGVILVTSASTSEGKSLLASALAASLCTSGKRVFLMECNPASPSIQNWFPQAGGYSSWSNDLETLRYGASNLFLLPAHDLPSYEVADLMDGYRAWIHKASYEVDWIVLDGASLLRGFADVAQLAPLASDILFVHDETRTNGDQVRAALNLLRPLARPDTLRGMVMNRHGS